MGEGAGGRGIKGGRVKKMRSIRRRVPGKGMHCEHDLAVGGDG